MKVWFRCNKCGKAFEAEERVRTDICPHCMSFIDLSRAEKITAADDKNAAKEENIFAANSARATSTSPEFSAKTAAMPSAKERANGAPPAKVAGTPARDISPQGCPAGADGEDTYESLYDKAEKMLTFGAWGNAAELFRHCLAKRECWQARFGLVRASTRELTDLSNFSAVQKDADAAFDKMTAEERLSLGKRYVPKLEEKRQSLKRSYAALAVGERLSTEQEGNSVGKNKRRKGAVSGIAIIVACAIVMVFLIIIGVVVMFETKGGGEIIYIALVLGVSGIVIGVQGNAREKKIWELNESVRTFSENSRQAERAKLKAQIDAVDYLCGFLKY